jgi:hypothetical protein
MYVIVSTAVCVVITLQMFVVYPGFKPYQFYDNTGNVTRLYKANMEIEDMLYATALPRYHRWFVQNVLFMVFE